MAKSVVFPFLKVLPKILFSALFLTSKLALAGGGVSVSSSGTPNYSIALKLPPGIAGMTPNLGLSYTGSGINGPVGYGWAVQGLSSITRCPGTIATDFVLTGVAYAASDKLCLDGQRLIQTDANGQPIANSTAANGQLSDALGVASNVLREYRTEKDSYARIRAFGYANGDSTGNSGPAFFRVWTKSGQIYDYGATPNADGNTNALIPAQNKPVPMAWAVARISDTLGNYIDFKYVQRDTAWGSGATSGSPQYGREWNLVQVQYTGTSSQAATNVVVFDYLDRPSTSSAAQDRAEAYHKGSKNVSIARLRAIRSYINWSGPSLGVTPQGTIFPNVPTAAGVGSIAAVPNGAVKVSTLKIDYTNGAATGRSLVSRLTECVGAAEAQCQPATTFAYTTTNDQGFTPNSVFASSSLSTTTKMIDSTGGKYGVLLGSFFGNGRTDILRWGTTTTDNQLFKSNGDGGFIQVTAGSGAGQFNMTAQKLFSDDGCYSSVVADFNADGISDLLRVVQSSNGNGSACPTDPDQIFISNGDGSFRSPVALQGIDLSTAREVTTYTNQNGCTPGPLPIAPRGRSIGAAPASGSCDPLMKKSDGKSFYLIDVNGDGILDIVTTLSPAFTVSADAPAPSADSRCASRVCTHVYIGSQASPGTFTERTATSLAHHSVYSDPPTASAYASWFKPATVDADGDGLTDLVVQTGVWRSTGNSNSDFNLISAAASSACAMPIDFNGDGRADCLFPTQVPISSTTGNQYLKVMNGVDLSAVASFNLTNAGQDLFGVNANNVQSIGILIGDFNGDGKSDILRWKDDPTGNILFLSNGDGTFKTSSPASFNLNTAARGLQNSDGKTAFLAADFTGKGSLEILRMKDSPSGTAEGTTNQLYVRNNSMPPDLLQTITSPTGIKNVFTYVPLTNAGSTLVGVTSRYSPGTASTYPKTNVSAPIYVVATMASDTGIANTSPINTEFTYQGLRANLLGRGLLGFDQSGQQSIGPNGQVLSTITNYLQDHPYIGVASVSQNFTGSLGIGTLLSRTTNSYCDATSPSTQGTAVASAGQPPAPCSTVALIQRPYLYQSLDDGRELDGSALPVVTTTNLFNASGDPSSITIKTVGTGAGVGQTFTKITSNIYDVNTTSCAADNQTCSWVLGRLKQATVTSSVPPSLASISTVAGNSTYASAIQGSGPPPPAPPPLNPAVLSAILQMLLND